MPSAAEIEASLRQALSGEARLDDMLTNLRFVTPKVDAQVVGEVFARGIDGERSNSAVSASAGLAAPMIRAVAAHLDGHTSAPALFLRALIDPDLDDRALEERWAESLLALRRLDVGKDWGSRTARARLQAVAREPHQVAALQAAAVGAKQIDLSYLAVLAADASEASLDALAVHVERATTDPTNGLERLQRLKTHAADTDAMRAMFERLARTLSSRKAASPAIAFARTLGLGELKDFWFEDSAGSVELTRTRVPRYRLSIAMRSTREAWFQLSVSQLPKEGGITVARRSSFDSETTVGDELKLGAPDAATLPQWLARAAKKLRTRWTWNAQGPRTGLRGTKRAALRTWLRSQGA